MNEQTRNNDEIEIDLQRLMDALLRQRWQIAAVSVLCALIAIVSTFLFVAPGYQSSVMFYVSNNTLVDNYIVILDTRETLLEVIHDTGTDRTVTALRKMIEAEIVDTTQFFRVTVTSPDPQEAEELANAVARILPRRIAEIVEGATARVADAPVVALRPSSPDYCIVTLIGFLVGFVLSAGAIALKELRDWRLEK